MKEYTKIIITANALVPKGAVQEKAFFKDNEQRVLLTDVQKSEDKQMMYSIMFHLNKADSQDCIVKKQEVLEEAAREFFKTGSKTLKMLHDGAFVDSAEMQELWIIKAGDPIFTKPEQIGALANCIYFKNKELFQKMKTEGWETSIEGVAEEVEIEKELNETVIEKIYLKLKNMFTKENIKKEVNMMPTKEELAPIIMEIITPILEALETKLTSKPETVEVEAACAPATEEMKKELAEVKKSLDALKVEYSKQSTQVLQFENTEVKKSKSTIFG